MRRIDAEFVRHTLQDVTLKYAATNPKSDAFLKARIEKANKILESEEKKTTSYPFAKGG